MSSIKRFMEDEEALRETAKGLLIETGKISECPDHPGTFLGEDDDLVDAYKLGNSRISRGEIDLGHRSRADFTKIIDEVYSDNSGYECYSCEKRTAE